MVVRTFGSQLKGNLSAQQECVMTITVTSATCLYSSETAVLVNSNQQLHDLSVLLCLVLHRMCHCEAHFQAAGVFHCLEKCSWSRLRRLDVDDSPQLEVDSASRFLMHCLTHLRIANSCSDAPALFKFSTLSNWSLLFSIQLPNNQLDGNAISAMTHAEWPFLNMLNLSFDIDGLGVPMFAKTLVTCDIQLL